VGAEVSVSAHVLYRMFDAEDHLLYVGLTNNPRNRFSGHSKGKAWWPEVAHIRVETFATRDELIAAEKAAIQTERPWYNITHNDPDHVLAVSFEEEEDAEDEAMAFALAKCAVDEQFGHSPDELVANYSQYVREVRDRRGAMS
jgi:excinuclease UvrABC nuclease subunit